MRNITRLCLFNTADIPIARTKQQQSHLLSITKLVPPRGRRAAANCQWGQRMHVSPCMPCVSHVRVHFAGLGFHNNSSFNSFVCVLDDDDVMRGRHTTARKDGEGSVGGSVSTSSMMAGRAVSGGGAAMWPARACCLKIFPAAFHDACLSFPTTHNTHTERVPTPAYARHHHSSTPPASTPEAKARANVGASCEGAGGGDACGVRMSSCSCRRCDTDDRCEAWMHALVWRYLDGGGGADRIGLGSVQEGVFLEVSQHLVDGGLVVLANLHGRHPGHGMPRVRALLSLMFSVHSVMLSCSAATRSRKPTGPMTFFCQ